MNILLFVIQDTFVGGAESVLHQISDYYMRRGHEVYVLFFFPKKYGHWETVIYLNLHLLYGGGVGESLSNILTLRKVKFDYSYSSLVDLTGILGILRKLHILHINKMIGRESTSIFDRFKGISLWRKKLMYRLGYPAVDVLICQTSYMKERLLANLPWIENKSKVIVVPNPVDLEIMSLRGEESLDVTTYQPYIVTAGRFIPEKGYDVLINAFSLIKKTHLDLQLVILGDGNLRASLEKLVLKLGLKESVHMPGFSGNVYPWFRQAQLCVISSRVEGFPNVLLQMMAQNDRVVSTLCAGDIDKIEGLYTCQTDSVESLALAIEDALTQTDAAKNRALFDKELQSRSVEKFVKTVENT